MRSYLRLNAFTFIVPVENLIEKIRKCLCIMHYEYALRTTFPGHNLIHLGGDIRQ